MMLCKSKTNQLCKKLGDNQISRTATEENFTTTYQADPFSLETDTAKVHITIEQLHQLIRNSEQIKFATPKNEDLLMLQN